jgi:hypothetical protein
MITTSAPPPPYLCRAAIAAALLLLLSIPCVRATRFYSFDLVHEYPHDQDAFTEVPNIFPICFSSLLAP